MPWPLSWISTQTSSPSTPVLTVMVPRSSMAWLALSRMFMNTWFNSDGRHCTNGSLP